MLTRLKPGVAFCCGMMTGIIFLTFMKVSDNFAQKTFNAYMGAAAICQTKISGNERFCLPKMLRDIN
jgi:hypothetical protein